MNWKSPVVRIILFLLVAGAAGVGVLSYHEYQRGERIQSEIDTLKSEADRVQLENGDLSQKIMYFDSPDFQEREAKDKLGFRRQEEQEVLLSGAPTLQEEDGVATTAVDHSQDENIPNYRKWWNLFFR